ncbi:N-acetylmuramoyl-L-alanine amidase [Bacillus sp. JCM 19034]|uniref:peptidoglycan recognition protein family protein n=1 Tax=Bacillus sp. JCM 19034 TaxID=1481928 RepID=UPI000785CD57|nr:N-acetylmuramoyl-L-alanine amidase [Bacillus sp. JCM 19034]
MVAIKKQLVSQSVINQRSYGKGNKKTSVTVHQTGNTNKGANAQAHANLQSRLNSRQASWHYQVDDKDIIQSFDDDVMCWHATDGRGPGNRTSISIELCINSDADYKKTLENGAALIKYLMEKYNLSIKDVKQHADWANKNCPAQLRAAKDGVSWSNFLKIVAGKGEQVKGEVKKVPEQTYKPKSSTTITKQTDDAYVRTIQEWINNYGFKNKIDGLPGPQTLGGLIRVLQSELNRQFNAGLTVDGIIGPKTRSKLVTVRNGARGNITRVLQALLYIKGFNPGPFDGIYGSGTEKAVREFQRSQQITVDGIVGPQTWGRLFGQ